MWQPATECVNEANESVPVHCVTVVSIKTRAKRISKAFLHLLQSQKYSKKWSSLGTLEGVATVIAKGKACTVALDMLSNVDEKSMKDDSCILLYFTLYGLVFSILTNLLDTLCKKIAIFNLCGTILYGLVCERHAYPVSVYVNVTVQPLAWALVGLQLCISLPILSLIIKLLRRLRALISSDNCQMRACLLL